MNLKSSGELSEIIKTRNTEEWSEEAILAAEEVLNQRGFTPPQEKHEKHSSAPLENNHSSRSDNSVSQAFGCGIIAAVAAPILAILGILIHGSNPFETPSAIWAVAPVAFVFTFFRMLRGSAKE